MDPAVSRLAAEVAALRRQVEALARTPHGGTGVGPAAGTLYGAAHARATQLGFPAGITGPYDADTGYPWKALELDRTVPEVTDPAVQPTGDYAFTVDDDQTLAEGTRVWLEPDPNATGYIIVSGTGGSSAWFFAQITGGSDAAGYSWKRRYLSAPATWSDATEPEPLTGTNNAYRPPSAVSTNIPAIPSGQNVMIRPSPTLDGKYEVGPWGGRQAVTVVSNVECVDGELVVTTKTLTGRDLSLV